MKCKTDHPKTALCACSLGFAFGITKALMLLLLAWVGFFFGYGHAMITEIATFYHGYGATFGGGLFGALWGFIDGFLFGFIAGLFYNLFLCHCFKKSCDKNETST